MFPTLPPPTGTAIRVATFNAALNRNKPGELAANLASGDPQASKIAALIQCVGPDILLVNELDYEPGTPQVFLDKYLRNPQPGTSHEASRELLHCFSAPVNTGVDSGMDLNNNRRLHDSDDGWGYGAFPGQYGMAVFSRFPIDRDRIRTFQNFPWSQMPSALRPKAADNKSAGNAVGNTMGYFHSDEVWQKLRLSSKSHWDVPIDVAGRTLHVIASHPTPPVFDGPEDRNGRRNHDEIRMLVDLVSADGSGDYLVDDNGVPGGLLADAHFVVLGDLNSDPNDGDGIHAGIRKLIEHPRVAQGAAPQSQGGVEASQLSGNANNKQQGDPASDTGDFNDKGPGNLRIDYALPSSNCRVVASGVYWPSNQESQAGNALVQASDHRLVWVDIELK